MNPANLESLERMVKQAYLVNLANKESRVCKDPEDLRVTGVFLEHRDLKV